MALPDKKRNMIRAVTIPIEPGRSLNIYRYGTTEIAASVLAAGYFNFFRDTAKHEDVVYAFVGIDTDLEILRLKFDAVPATGDVTVVDMDAP